MRKRKLFFLIPVAAILLLALLVMLCWNAVLPQVTGFRPITYWQAMALFVLCKILFGFGIKPGGGFGRGRRFRSRFNHMTPEEREKVKDWFSHCEKDPRKI